MGLGLAGLQVGECRLYLLAFGVGAGLEVVPALLGLLFPKLDASGFAEDLVEALAEGGVKELFLDPLGSGAAGASGGGVGFPIVGTTDVDNLAVLFLLAAVKLTVHGASAIQSVEFALVLVAAKLALESAVAVGLADCLAAVPYLRGHNLGVYAVFVLALILVAVDGGFLTG